jgi:chloramphenicol 3-O phosphotransferase
MLIGTSCAGKSSTARKLQDILDEHYLLLGSDTFFHMVSPRWGGGLGGPLSWEGFRYDRSTESPHGHKIVTIKYGAVGVRVLRGMHRAIAALAQSGNNIIVDEMLLDRWVLNDWINALFGLRVFIVRLWAPVSVLEERERARGNEGGLARGHFKANTLAHYDLEIDTSVLIPAEAADRIARWMINSPKPTAMLELHATVSTN